MKAVFVGSGTQTVMTTRELLHRGVEVIIIERDKARIDELAEELDCGFLHGDGSRPSLLREADPQEDDVLFCLTDSDQTNILAALVGRSVGYRQVVPRIQDPAFEHICIELGLDDTVFPARTVGRLLAGMLGGGDNIELSTFIKGDARVFAFVVSEQDAVAAEELRLPPDTRILCLYRNDEFVPVDPDTRLKADDEVVLITHVERLDELHERWSSTGRSGRHRRSG